MPISISVASIGAGYPGVAPTVDAILAGSNLEPWRFPESHGLAQLSYEEREAVAPRGAPATAVRGRS